MSDIIYRRSWKKWKKKLQKGENNWLGYTKQRKYKAGKKGDGKINWEGAEQVYNHLLRRSILYFKNFKWKEQKETQMKEKKAIIQEESQEKDG